MSTNNVFKLKDVKKFEVSLLTFPQKLHRRSFVT